MESTTDTPTTSLFNNPLFSDVTIRQTYNGVAKEFYAHKAILCSSSAWFTKALTGDFKEATSSVIEVHDDDPVYFELLLNFLYTYTWDHDIASSKEITDTCGVLLAFVVPIGVYALADKYDIPALRSCAIEQVPEPPRTKGARTMTPSEAMEIMEAHYNQCVKAGSCMGRRICAYLLKNGTAHIKKPRFAALGVKYPQLVIDMFWVARNDNDGKLC